MSSAEIISIETPQLIREERVRNLKNQLREFFEPIGPRYNQEPFTAVGKIDEYYLSDTHIGIWAQLMMSGKIRKMTIITQVDEAHIYFDRAGKRRHRRSPTKLGKEVSDEEYLLYGPKALAILTEIEKRRNKSHS